MSERIASQAWQRVLYHADATPEIADFSTPDSCADNGELAHWDSRAVKSFFDDAARFVPELQSVVVGILSAPVRIPPRPEWMAALRERWEALAAEYVAPLPEGDAGIIAAIERARDLEVRDRAIYREFNVTFEIEADVRNPIIGPALDHLNDYILDTPPVGRDGVLAKLRYVIDDRNGLITEGAAEPLKQVLAVLERDTA